MQKRQLGFWDIWNMSFGFLGIQMGFALQNGNASRILQSFGADVHELSWFWLVAPLTGMIVQPIIGYYSDRTWNRLGRRKPYFLAGTIICCLALIVLPNSGGWFTAKSALLIGAGMLMLMDASINVAMEPFRALVADNLPDNQRTFGFTVQTFLIGVGAVAGSYLPLVLRWLGVSNEAPAGEAPDNVIYSFYIGAAVFIVTILVTILKTREYDPIEYAEIHGKPERHHTGLAEIFRDFARMPATMRQLGLVQFFTWFALFSMWVFTTPAITRQQYDTSVSPENFAAIRTNIEGSGADHAGEMLQLLDEASHEPNNDGEIYIDNKVASFLSERLVNENELLEWISNHGNHSEKIAEVWLSRQDNDPSNDRNVPYSELVAAEGNSSAEMHAHFPNLGLLLMARKIASEHGRGGDWVGAMFGLYNLVSALFAFLLPVIAGRIGRKRTHAFSLVAGGAGLISMFFVRDPDLLLIPMVGVGIAWASILAMPYAILAGSIPAGKMGVYMGIFNFFITLPQIINGIVGGLIVKHIYNSQAIYALVLAGVFMLCAAVTVLYVKDQPVIRLRKV